MRIGFHAPFPPAPTGVADYAEALAGELTRLGEVRRNPRAPCDVELYHLGNNALHRHIYERALARPGVVVLHDAVLHHFLLGLLDRQAYIDEFVYNYGAWYGELAARLWERRARSAQDPLYFRFPMLRRLVERARAVVVHNPAAVEMVRAHAPGVRLVRIPHLFAPPQPAPGWQVARWRARLGVPPSATLFGVFGHLRESKRLAAILRAFRRLRRERPDTALLVAGRFASAELERALAPAWSEPGILRTGLLPEREFWIAASAVDVVLNLRYPAAGETSGITIRLMGLAKPVILSAGPENADLPEGTCLRVDPGLAEEEMLLEYMAWLAQDPEAGRSIGRLAAEYIRQEHAPARCAALYASVLEGAAG